MNPVWKFRFFALLLTVFVTGISIANLLAEFLRPAVAPLPSTTGYAPDQLSAAKLASAIAPFRSDLRAERAVMLAGQALKSEGLGKPERQQMAQDAALRALNIGPHDARTWLVLAMLQASSKPVDPRLAESLKMSYLTGPNRAELISTRLQSVTSSSALSDPDLRDLARSDIRAIFTRFPDQRQALVDDYGHASGLGKMFLEESVKTIDPEFVDTLRNTN